MSGNGRGRRRRKRTRKSCGGRKWPPVVMRVRGSRASRHRGAKLKAAVEQAKEARHHEMRQFHRALLKANTENDTLCRLLDEAVRLHDGTRKLHDQKDVVADVKARLFAAIQFWPRGCSAAFCHRPSYFWVRFPPDFLGACWFWLFSGSDVAEPANGLTPLRVGCPDT